MTRSEELFISFLWVWIYSFIHRQQKLTGFFPQMIKKKRSKNEQRWETCKCHFQGTVKFVLRFQCKLLSFHSSKYKVEFLGKKKVSRETSSHSRLEPGISNAVKHLQGSSPLILLARHSDSSRFVCFCCVNSDSSHACKFVWLNKVLCQS